MAETPARRKALPKQPYRTVEWHLHNVRALEETIRRGEETILCGGPDRDRGTPGGHSRHADPTAVKGVLLSDGTREMRRARRWLDAIDATRRYFAGTPHMQLLVGFYGRGVRAPDFREAHGLGKTRFYDMRDEVVNHCAMQAIGRGLMRLEKTKGAESEEA